jgi:hypothetical protein
MFLQPDWWGVMQAGVGTNHYSYSFGDPVNGIDPSGHDVILVDGTSSNGRWRKDDKANSQDLFSRISRSFTGQKIYSLGNLDMDNTPAARTKAAQQLSALVDSIYKKDRYAEINIISHSHGGNVIKEYSQMKNAKPITRAITLGNPQRTYSYRSGVSEAKLQRLGPSYEMNLDIVGFYLNVYSNLDYVQAHGGMDGSKFIAGIYRESAGRIDSGVDLNSDASSLFGVEVDHYSFFNDDPYTIHSAEVWRAYVDEYINTVRD